MSERETYRTLNDAPIEELKRGHTQIWYQKPIKERMFTTEEIDPDNLRATHTLLGTVACDDVDRLFHVLQGDVWSPNGEARELIESLGLKHTSMSVGDVIVVGYQTLVCDDVGFKRL